MRLSQIAGPCLLAACATQSPSLPVPEASMVTLPYNAEAAEMTAQFAALMERKLPMLDRVAVIIARDRYVREVFIPQFSGADLDEKVRKQFQDRAGEYVTMIDRLNTAELKSVLEEYSWGDIVEGESVLFDRLFHVVQHSPDAAFRAQVLAEIKPYLGQGLIDKSAYALMYDKVELANGRGQLYGTQYKCVDGQYNIYNLNDADTVDARRAEMGLAPMDEYLKIGREMYGPCAE